MPTVAVDVAEAAGTEVPASAIPDELRRSPTAAAPATAARRRGTRLISAPPQPARAALGDGPAAGGLVGSGAVGSGAVGSGLVRGVTIRAFHGDVLSGRG
ncbi:hypothetical protein GCM10010977_19390 [Citricoccus zhacaiensis]|uniref:Uncharacterized protein n=1 Tax=Citricoccus zhacaiensis TaxID=489142 RepID=A0ABQ2M1Q1_9MICC|nr:hypothetical protein GCM10010977_19390 [Citricoccus zhacaiensis]